MKNEDKGIWPFIVFQVLLQIPIGLLWWWKWDTMTTTLCWTMYFTTGFVLATSLVSFMPWKVDDEDGLWFWYFGYLFAWPLVILLFDVILFFGAVFLASQSIAFIVRKIAGVEE